MRKTLIAITLASTTLLAACSDEPIERTQPPGIPAAVEEAVISKKMYGLEVKSVSVNPDLSKEGETITLIHLKWNVKNSPKMSLKMIHMYSAQILASLVEEKEVNKGVFFWEVPYLLEGINVAKIEFWRSGDSFLLKDQWLAPVLRDL